MSRISRLAAHAGAVPSPFVAVRRFSVVALLAVVSTQAMPAGAAQTCDTSRHPLSTARDRFEEHDDGTVTDLRSRLMWMRCSAGQSWSAGRCVGAVRNLDFQSAQSLVTEINRSGSSFWSDWRVPRAPELASIAERQCDDPRIDLALFPGTPSEFYWTATSRPQSTEKFVFALSFGAEGIRYLSKEEALHLRLVRDAR